MSEINTHPEKKRNLTTKVLVVVLAIGIPLLVYGAGYLVFPVSILSSYGGRDCDTVASLNKIYTSIYPAFIQDLSFSDKVAECEGYLQALSNEQSGKWQAAYDAYQAYSATYPNGLYAKDAYEHGAAVLMSLAKDQAVQKNYGEALANLKLIVSNYADLNVSAEALPLISSTYSSWSDDMREAENFGEAERVFIEFRAWAQANQKPELETDALDGLAQIYLDWGSVIQPHKDFEAALVKFDMAANLGAGLSPDVAAEIRSHQRKLYVEWGNVFLEQDEFASAVDKFKLGASKSDGNDEDGVSGALINGYIEWADKFSVDEDFESALEKLTIAEQMAVSDELKKTVDEARDDTYLAFSNSDGVQAKRAIRVALIAICDKKKKPDVPIFGLNPDLVRFGMYGVDDQLPNGLAAETPGEMHYVACVKEDDVIVNSRSHREIILQVSKGYYYQIIQQHRAKHVWDIHLTKMDTLDVIAEMSFTGGEPPFFEDAGTYFYGTPPEMTEVTEWLKASIK